MPVPLGRRVLGAMLLILVLVPPGSVARAAPSVAAPGFRAPLLPVTVLVPFRPPANPYGAGHRGVDLAAAAGDQVRAPGPGRVVFAGHLVDRGVVSVEHDGGLRTTYEPVTAAVRAGQVVAAGALLGTVQAGHPPCAPADCLHWGARIAGSYVDPMLLLTGWRVRLLPWDG